MNFLDKSTEMMKMGGKAIYDFFPKKLTFWSVLFYFFFFYFIVYGAFSIYIYANGLEYQNDSEHPDNKKMDGSEQANDTVKPTL